MATQFACEPATTSGDVYTSGCECALDEIPWDIDDLIDAASDALFLLSGGSMAGRCTTTVRPCEEGTCACGGIGCMCCDIPGIPLPGYRPTVSEVKIDGVVVPADEYVMVNGYKLARVEGRWPSYQPLLRPDTEDGTFSVTFASGQPWDFLSQMAAIELVCEMAKSLTGGSGLLPKGTVSATADGVQIVIGRMPGMEEVTAVGLTWLGRWLAAYGGQQNARVSSPELREGWVLHTIEFS